MSATHVARSQFEEIVLADGIVLIDFWADWCGPCKPSPPVYETFSKQYPEVAFIKVDTAQV